MKKNMFIALVLTLTVLSAQAANSCLQSVSNSDLLMEVSARLSSSGPAGQTGNLLITAMCNGGTLEVNKVDFANTTTKNIVSEFTGTSDCLILEASINFKAKQITNGGQFAYCSSGTLEVVTLFTNGTEKKQSTFLGGSACQEKVKQINGK